MKNKLYWMVPLLVLLAVNIGDWMGKPRRLWVFAVPSSSPDVLIEEPSKTGMPRPGSRVIPVSPPAQAMAPPMAEPPATAEPEAGKDTLSTFTPPDVPGLALPSFSNVGRIAVIHSKSLVLFKDNKPLPGQLERLHDALAALERHVDHPFVILDADGSAPNTVHQVLYADPKHDVTPLVRNILTLISQHPGQSSLTGAAQASIKPKDAW